MDAQVAVGDTKRHGGIEIILVRRRPLISRLEVKSSRPIDATTSLIPSSFYILESPKEMVLAVLTSE